MKASVRISVWTDTGNTYDLNWNGRTEGIDGELATVDLAGRVEDLATKTRAAIEAGWSA